MKREAEEANQKAGEEDDVRRKAEEEVRRKAEIDFDISLGLKGIYYVDCLR